MADEVIMSGEGVIVNVSLSGRSGRKEMIITKQDSLSRLRNSTSFTSRMFKNGSCSDTESTDLKVKI